MLVAAAVAEAIHVQQSEDRMKKAFFTFLVLCVAAGTVFSQETSKAQIPCRSGDRALLFDLSGLAYLAAGDYEGGLGFQYYIGKDLALRFGVGISSSSQTDKQANPPAGQLSESKRTSFEWSLTPGIRYNIAQNKSVLAYVGGVFSISMVTQERTGRYTGLDPAGYVNGAKYVDQTTYWGAALLLGVEWFAWDNVSFSGEYRLGFESGSGYTEATNPNATPTKTKVDKPSTFGFGIGSANSGYLTLAVYF
jgi:hypothetical protein